MLLDMLPDMLPKICRGISRGSFRVLLYGLFQVITQEQNKRSSANREYLNEIMNKQSWFVLLIMSIIVCRIDGTATDAYSQCSFISRL